MDGSALDPMLHAMNSSRSGGIPQNMLAKLHPRFDHGRGWARMSRVWVWGTMMKRWTGIGVVLWFPLWALAQEAEVFPLPDRPPPGDTRFEAGQDEDEVNIPVLPGTAAVKPPPVNPEPGAANHDLHDLHDLPRPAPARPGALGTPILGGDPLLRFAQAHREIAAIHARYARLMPAADAVERQSLVAGGNAEMRAAIQRAGLTVAQYNAISLRRWEDPTFARMLNETLERNL